MKNWRALRLLIFVSFLNLTSHFEVREDEWDEIDPEIAALHRLAGISKQMFHERPFINPATIHGARVERSSDRADFDQNPMSLQDGLQECESFTACVIQKEKDFDGFLADVDEQKNHDWLVSASEISHSYSQKLLLMTDRDKSTIDRVHREYSADPHYSIIVSNNCTEHSVSSCVPEAHADTIVKVFGTVSEDGQTVSGLSGSELAELLLKLSLEVAPVFSLDANTTNQMFIQNFLRVFKVRGIKAVLETNQKNQQTYQLMNENDLISGYKIPQRKVDHSTQYDHQQIIVMENDPVVNKAAEFLFEKHPKVSSMYVLDKKQRLKLVHGESVPLTENSRLVLVGHGKRNAMIEMKVSGYGAKDIGKIIQQTFRVGDKIKTISVVACEVGSDREFVETVVREIHENANIQTEVHFRDAVVQVRHTGEKITQGISAGGLEWRHKDDSKKVVATLDRNGDVIVRYEPGSKGEAVFNQERNLLGLQNKNQVKSNNIESGLVEPKRYIDQVDIQAIKIPGMKPKIIDNACYELEALTWAIFRPELPKPKAINTENLQLKGNYLIAEGKPERNKEIKLIANEKGLKNVLENCYEIKSLEDVRNVIHYFAMTKERNKPKYLMVNDWIYHVNPKDMYVYPVGKKLGNNQRDEKGITKIKNCIIEQVGKESYTAMRSGNRKKHEYASYVQNLFSGQSVEHSYGPSLDAWYTTYLTASIICESVRNYRTFPLVLMALDMVQSGDHQHIEKGKQFLWEEHSMARGGSWPDTSKYGFSGSASDGKGIANPKLTEVLTKEVQQIISFASMEGKFKEKIERIAGRITESNSNENIVNKYNTYKTEIDNKPLGNRPSGTLGGSNDGRVTSQDLRSAIELENSFKLESYFSRAGVLSAEQIHDAIKAKFGENTEGWHLQEGTARIENGEFISHFVSEGAMAEPVEFRVALSPESRGYNEKMLRGIDQAVHDLETHGSTSQSPHEVNKYVEHTGSAVGAVGLMLGMKGAVAAFEQGDIKDGVMGALQTAHGATAMTVSVIAKQAMASEGRVARAAAGVMRSPALKGTLQVIPFMGLAFGVFNLEQDLERGDTQGYIDAALDGSMVILDVIEMAAPELAPFIAPINLALSVVRMIFDDVYMGIQTELNNLPEDAGVLEKLGAVVLGFVEGIGHFEIQVLSFFYDWHYEEIEEGRRLVAQISDYRKYYQITKEHDGTNAIDFSSGASSWNGGGIHFSLKDNGQAELCMDYFVSSDESVGKRCWNIDTDGSKDIILGLGESQQLEHKTLKNKILLFIPAGSVTVVSGYKAVSNSRYGIYKGNRDSNRFFASQKAEDQHTIEVMLSYYYSLYGEPGDDTFFLGPQKSYVRGSSGKDTYIIPANGGKTIINNYDPSKELDTLHFSVDYSHISVSKSGDDVVLMYEGFHTVTVEGWFLGELYQHMNIMSGDGVIFEISSTVVSSVRLVAREINKMFMTHGETVNASQPLLSTVTNIVGSQHDDVLIGNGEKNLMDGGGGRDRLIGGEGEDIYMVKDRKNSPVWIENYSIDSKTDLAIIEANLHTFKVKVHGDNVVLNALNRDNTAISVTLVRWFRSPADRHLLVLTKDLISFSISDNKTDCLQTESDLFSKCIKSHSIDYSSSSSPRVVDLQSDEAFDSVSEVRGSKFDDVIKGNKEHNVVYPGGGNDFIQGRGGEDWYIITPGQGVKTIDNQSPDLALDIIFLKKQYKYIECVCEGQSIIMLVNSRREVILQNWFESKYHQHLSIKTSDGITLGLMQNRHSCDFGSIIFPLTVDYRNQKPEPLDSPQTLLGKHYYFDHFDHFDYFDDEYEWSDGCYRYQTNSSEEQFCGFQVKVMMASDAKSVKDMYGSAGFDIMVGNSNENLLDPYTGGALMFGGEGKDTYIMKHGYGNELIIDNFAEDGNIDTVLVDMDFLGGSQVSLDLSMGDLNVMITTKGEQLKIRLLNYNKGNQHRHLEFQSSDGVNFRLKKSPTSTAGDLPLFEMEAFKVTLKQLQKVVDCRLDLNSQRNMSKVHTVQGCPSQSNDILGNAIDNALFGGWKDDALEGGEGDDTLMGGKGNDILIGGLGGDTLYGEDGNDTLMGNWGQDVFMPGLGADLVDGGPGRDTVLYRGDHDTGKGVYVNLLTGQGRYADAEGDVLKDVENVVGSIYADVLVSGYESSLLKGSDGNDILTSSFGNWDYLIGGDGNDIYMVAFDNGSVTIDNCAKDNATDILYLNSQSTMPIFDCQHLPERALLLTFFGVKPSTSVKITLEGWISDDNECGHLKLVFGGIEVSVDRLLESRLRQKEADRTLAMILVVCVSLVLFHLCVLIFEKCRKKSEKAQRIKRQTQTDMNVGAESVSMVGEENVEFST